MRREYLCPKLELVEFEENQVFMAGSSSENGDATGAGEDFPWGTFEKANVWE